jgi:SAM-dependent methyltransferase
VLERTAGRLPATGRVLDIGCGMGGMLVPFVLAGHHVNGCDFGEEYVQLGRRLGMDIRTGGPEAIAAEGPFDLILLSHVLQHVRDPVGLARQAASLLKPQGLCFVEVPGLLNLERYYGGDLLQYFQNANRWHFTAGTLTAILRRAGLEIMEIDQTVTCLATPGKPDPIATSSDGPIVLAEIRRLESALAAKAAGGARAS